MSDNGSPVPSTNVAVYGGIGFLYDAVIGPASGEVRRRAADALAQAPGRGGRLLVVGVGSGLDLPFLPRDTRGIGVDLSRRMLARADRRRAESGMRWFELERMDAQSLSFEDGAFDAVYLPLILTVVPDGARALGEASRVVKPGGRVVVADRFWAGDRTPPTPVRAASKALGRCAMRFDLPFASVHSGAPELELEDHQRVGPGRFFHLVTLRRTAP